MNLRTVVDKRGRFFGKLHIFDLLIILILLCATTLVVKNIFRSSSWVTVDVKIVSDGRWDTIDFIPPPNWLGNALHVGEKEFDWDGGSRAEILDKRLYDTGYDRSFLYLTIKLKSSYNAKNKTYSYKNRVLGVGSAIDLLFPTASVKGLIIDLDSLQIKKYLMKKITVELYDRRPWFAETVRVGDSAIAGGATIAKVLTKSVRPAEKSTIVTDYNRTMGDNNRLSIAGIDPTRKDITLTLELRVNEDENGFLMFRDDQRVRIGNTLWIALPQITLNGATVVSIE